MINKYNKIINKRCKVCGNSMIITNKIAQKYHPICYKDKIKNKNKIRCKLWNVNNKERVHLNKLNYYKNHASKIKEYGIKYYQENKPAIRKYMAYHVKTRRHTNPEFAIKGRLQCILRRAMNLYTTEGKIWNSRKYGIDYNSIINHLKPFPKEISRYHIDHIKPLSSFNLNDKKQVKLAFSPENHQWLTIKQNISKGGTNKRDWSNRND